MPAPPPPRSSQASWLQPQRADLVSLTGLSQSHSLLAPAKVGHSPVSKSASTTKPAHSTQESSDAETQLFLTGLTCKPHLVQLGRTAVTFGRAPACDVQLDTAEASRAHAEIVRVGPVYVVRDLGSRNGTFVNAARVKEAPVCAGAVLRMGDWLATVTALKQNQPPDFRFAEQAPGLWGSQVLRDALSAARLAAQSDLPIVIEGETGTGKELLARAVHHWSGRSGPFVAINCAALPEALAEGELFGYRRGAFTGAERPSQGLIRAAHGGTLLLDEICDLSAAMQVKLLRVLEEREVTPLGESKPVAIDVRVVSAAQAPLLQVVQQRGFRADLYARLNGLTVQLPALRQRVQDVPRLVEHFMRECQPESLARLSVNALHALCVYDWPFNVRELRLLSRRLAVLHGHEATIHANQLPDQMRLSLRDTNEAERPAAAKDSDLNRLLEELRRHSGNVTRAAGAAGISRMRAYRLMNNSPELNLQDFRRGLEGSS